MLYKNKNIDDIRIDEYKLMIAPEELIKDLSVDEKTALSIGEYRDSVKSILEQKDDRLLVVVGPCSIHSVESAFEYAQRLKKLSDKLQNDLMIVMRVYFEKPRTTVGWKGLINDPDLNGSFKINKGLRMARELLIKINQLGLPAGTEFLDLITPQYVADLVSWGAIGARTTESQCHRELTSGLSCPIGFKNGTSGDCDIARDAILASSQTHIFLSINKEGRCATVKTKGNQDCHLILRGGKKPNYDAVNVDNICNNLAEKNITDKVMIDFSHGNSLKQFQRQKLVAEDVAIQLSNGENRIFGVMLESFLEEGNQPINSDLSKLTYGQSVTDACIGWDETEHILTEILAKAVQKRRKD